MKQLHRQKGQSFVEFSIVLLIFIFMMFGGYLIFMLSYDYMTIASFARESARSLSVCTSTSAMETKWDTIEQDAADGNLSLGVYYSLDTSGSTITTPTSSDTSVRVHIKATRKQNAFRILPNEIDAEASMYWEKASIT